MELFFIILIILKIIKNNLKIIEFLNDSITFTKFHSLKQNLTNLEMSNVHFENRCLNKYLNKIRYNFNHRVTISIGLNKKHNKSISLRTTRFDKPVHDRKGDKLSTLSDVFDVSISVIHKIKTNLFPLMMEALRDQIKPWSNNISQSSLYAIGCTCHPIVRCHPGQRDNISFSTGHFYTIQNSPANNKIKLLKIEIISERVGASIAVKYPDIKILNPAGIKASAYQCLAVRKVSCANWLLGKNKSVIGPLAK
ncbi:hypothetical protein ACTFIZ_012888 [Dictyostelium cf. discoideum]